MTKTELTLGTIDFEGVSFTCPCGDKLNLGWPPSGYGDETCPTCKRTYSIQTETHTTFEISCADEHTAEGEY